MKPSTNLLLIFAGLVVLSSCSIAMQKNGQAFNYAGNVMGKQAFATMDGPAGSITGYVTDNTDAAKDVGNTLMGIEGIKGLTKTAINASNNATKEVISGNKTLLGTEKIKAGSATAKTAIEAGAEVMPIKAGR